MDDLFDLVIGIFTEELNRQEILLRLGISVAVFVVALMLLLRLTKGVLRTAKSTYLKIYKEIRDIYRSDPEKAFDITYHWHRYLKSRFGMNIKSMDESTLYEKAKESFLSMEPVERENMIKKSCSIITFGRYTLQYLSLIPLFTAVTILLYIFMMLFQLIQLHLMDSFERGLYFISIKPIAWLFPTFVLVICISALTLYPLYRERSVKRILGKGFYERESKHIRTYFTWGRLPIIFILIVGTTFSIFALLTLMHFAVVTDEGIYANPWFSFEYRFFPWDDLDKIYRVVGSVDRDGKIKIDKNPDYVIVMKDGTRISISNDPRVCGITSYSYQTERFGKTDEMISFIESKSGIKMMNALKSLDRDKIIYPIDTQS